jgi:hypothetical protein
MPTVTRYAPSDRLDLRQVLALIEFAEMRLRVVRLRRNLRDSLAGPVPRMRAAARRLAVAEVRATEVRRRIIPAPPSGGRAAR